MVLSRNVEPACGVKSEDNLKMTNAAQTNSALKRSETVQKSRSLGSLVMNIIWKGERRMCPALRLCDHLLSAARREEDPCARAGRFLLVNEGPHPDMGHGRTRPRVLVKGGGMHFDNFIPDTRAIAPSVTTHTDKHTDTVLFLNDADGMSTWSRWIPTCIWGNDWSTRDSVNPFVPPM